MFVCVCVLCSQVSPLFANAKLIIYVSIANTLKTPTERRSLCANERKLGACATRVTQSTPLIYNSRCIFGGHIRPQTI